MVTAVVGHLLLGRVYLFVCLVVAFVVFVVVLVLKVGVVALVFPTSSTPPHIIQLTLALLQLLKLVPLQSPTFKVYQVNKDL